MAVGRRRRRLALILVVFVVLLIFLVIPIPEEVSFKALDTDPDRCQPSPEKFTPTIHHIWLNYTAFPPQWEPIIRKCLDLNQDFSYKRWTATDVQAFLQEHYPWILPTYHSYDHNVQRVDAARLFILYHYGGVYMDMDLGCVTSFRDIVKERTDYDVILSRGSTFGVSNHIMLAKPRHPYLKLAIESLPSHNRWYGIPYITIMYTAGPGFLTVVLRNYTCKEHIYVFPPEPEHNTYYINFHGGTWHTWDTPIIDALGAIHKGIKHVLTWYALLLILFICLCSGYLYGYIYGLINKSQQPKWYKMLNTKFHNKFQRR